MYYIRITIIFLIFSVGTCSCSNVSNLFSDTELKKTFYKTGELECETTSQKKSDKSFQKCYFKSGVLKSETKITNHEKDKSITVYWGPPKDQIKELKSLHPDLFDKKIDMLSLEAHEILENNEFCQNGERARSQKEIIEDKIVSLQEFYCNGNVEYEEKYDNGILVESITYYRSGNIKYKDSYTDGILANGKVFSKEGNILLDETY